MREAVSRPFGENVNTYYCGEQGHRLLLALGPARKGWEMGGSGGLGTENRMSAQMGIL